MCIEDILQKHYGTKKVALKKDKAIKNYMDADGNDYIAFESLTVSGKKAFAKLIGLLRDLECIIDDYEATPWVSKLKEIASKRWNIFDNADIEDNVSEFRFVCLETIIQNQFGVKKVFLNKPIHRSSRANGVQTNNNEQTNYFTKTGAKAYGRLTELIYDLGELFNSDGFGFDVFNTCHIVGCLDDIVSECNY